MAGLVENAQNPDAGVGLPEAHRTVISTSIDVVDDSGNQIGYVQSINQSENRPTQPVRHLNSEDAGRIVEQAPQPGNLTLSVNGFAIYNKQNDGSVVQRIGGETTAKKMRTLEEQKIPFSLIVKETHPATQEVTQTVYHECWLTSRSKPVNIGTATIVESCNITPGWVD